MKKTSLGLIALVFLLTACAFSHQSSVPKNYEVERFELSSEWLQKNEDAIINAMTEAIRKRHPKTADWFPRIKISSIRTNDPVTARRIRHILSEVRKNLLPDSVDTETWWATLTIRAGSNTDPRLAQLLLFPAQAVMCFPSLMIICPCTETAVVTVTAEINTYTKEKIYFQGAGAANIWAGTPYIADNDEWDEEHTTKAFIAALTSLVDNLVIYAETQHNNNINR